MPSSSISPLTLRVIGSSTSRPVPVAALATGLVFLRTGQTRNVHLTADLPADLAARVRCRMNIEIEAARVERGELFELSTVGASVAALPEMVIGNTTGPAVPGSALWIWARVGAKPSMVIVALMVRAPRSRVSVALPTAAVVTTFGASCSPVKVTRVTSGGIGGGCRRIISHRRRPSGRTRMKRERRLSN